MLAVTTAVPTYAIFATQTLNDNAMWWFMSWTKVTFGLLICCYIWLDGIRFSSSIYIFGRLFQHDIISVYVCVCTSSYTRINARTRFFLGQDFRVPLQFFSNESHWNNINSKRKKYKIIKNEITNYFFNCTTLFVMSLKLLRRSLQSPPYIK